MTTDIGRPMNGRSEHDIVTRAGIPIVLGGETFAVRPRTIDADEVWTELVREKLLGSLEGATLDYRSILKLAQASTFLLAELIVAYDETNTVPTWEWIRKHATSQEVQDGFVTLLEHAFPPFGMSRRLIPADQRGQVVGMLLDLARDLVPMLPEMARLGRAVREAREAEEAGEAESSPKAPSTKPRSPSGGSARRTSSGRR